MKLTETLDSNIAAYEQKYGETVTPDLRELFERMAAAGDFFHDLGVNDAAAGRIPLTRAPFVEWAKEELKGRRYDETDDSLTTLMYMCYTDGYDSQKEQKA